MNTPEVPMDALRQIAKEVRVGFSQHYVDQIAAYVRAVDAERDARRDEALANMLRDAWLEAGRPRLLGDWRKLARAARDFIAKEQGQ